MEILIATGNKGKIREYAHLLAELPVPVLVEPGGCEIEVPLEIGGAIDAPRRCSVEVLFASDSAAGEPPDYEDFATLICDL